jgi:hypothetical protein
LGPIKLKKNTAAAMDDENHEKSTFGMIPWKDCDLIVKTSEIWLQELETNAHLFDPPFAIPPTLPPIWKQFRKIWQLIGSSDADLATFRKEPGNEQYQNQEAEFFAFGRALIAAYPDIYGWYFHIITCHTIKVR